MKIGDLTLALLLLMMTGCAIRATESDVARWHGFRLDERVPEFEHNDHERCYMHSAPPLRYATCYDLNAETDVNYTIDAVEKPER
jgi:hypothetical protein